VTGRGQGCAADPRKNHDQELHRHVTPAHPPRRRCADQARASAPDAGRKQPSRRGPRPLAPQADPSGLSPRFATSNGVLPLVERSRGVRGRRSAADPEFVPRRTTLPYPLDRPARRRRRRPAGAKQEDRAAGHRRTPTSSAKRSGLSLSRSWPSSAAARVAPSACPRHAHRPVDRYGDGADAASLGPRRRLAVPSAIRPARRRRRPRHPPPQPDSRARERGEHRRTAQSVDGRDAATAGRFPGRSSVPASA